MQIEKEMRINIPAITPTTPKLVRKKLVLSVWANYALVFCWFGDKINSEESLSLFLAHAVSIIEKKIEW